MAMKNQIMIWNKEYTLITENYQVKRINYVKFKYKKWQMSNKKDI